MIGPNFMVSRVGYIPILSSDPEYNNECIRQSKAGMPRCLCSNCEPEAAKSLMAAQPAITNDTFDLLVTSVYTRLANHPQMGVTISADHGLPHDSSPHAPALKLMDCKAHDSICHNPQMKKLALELRQNFNLLYTSHFAGQMFFLAATDLFPEEDLWKIVKNYKFFLNNGSP